MYENIVFDHIEYIKENINRNLPSFMPLFDKILIQFNDDIELLIEQYKTKSICK